MQRMRRAQSLDEDDAVMPTERQRAGADFRRLTRAKFVFTFLSLDDDGGFAPRARPG